MVRSFELRATNIENQNNDTTKHIYSISRKTPVYTIVTVEATDEMMQLTQHLRRSRSSATTALPQTAHGRLSHQSRWRRSLMTVNQK